MTFKEWGKYISEWRERKGFHTPATLEQEDAEAMLGKLMLVVTEVSEAAEAVRDGDTENFAEELADTFIRLLDIAYTQGINIEEEIEKKMAKNEGRPYQHGRKVTL